MRSKHRALPERRRPAKHAILKRLTIAAQERLPVAAEGQHRHFGPMSMVVYEIGIAQLDVHKFLCHAASHCRTTTSCKGYAGIFRSTVGKPTERMV